MAKRTLDKKFIPGVIYELGITTNIEWIPFYVGEAIDFKKRLSGHRSSSKHGGTYVYQYIRSLDSANIPWEIKQVDAYGEEGPLDKEHWHILKNLRNGIHLMNMKKGNQKWLTKIQNEVNEMQGLKINTWHEYKQHKKRLSDEEKEARHQQWLLEQADKDKLKQKTALDRLHHAAERIRIEKEREEKNKKDEELKFKKLKVKIGLIDLRGTKRSSNEKAQDAFDKGMFHLAMKELSGLWPDYKKFEEEFGISYHTLKELK